MKHPIILFFLLISFQLVNGQKIFKAIVKDKATKQLLQGVTVSVLGVSKTNVTSDVSGSVVINDLSNDTATIRFSYVGYKPVELTAHADTTIYIVLLQQDENTLQ